MKMSDLGFVFFKQIVQFSPPRTGSTLVFNILKKVFDKYEIRKTHIYKKKFFMYPVISTYRNPLDAISSSYQVKKLKPNEKNLIEIIKEFDKSNPLKLIELSKQSNVLLLKYENFYEDFDYIFNEIEFFFKIKIPNELKLEIVEELNIEKVNKKILKLNSFQEFENDTHWHGNHISKNKGKSSYNEMFTKEQISTIARHYKDFFDFFKYEVN